MSRGGVRARVADEHVRRDAQPLVQTADHRQRQTSLPVQHFGDPRPAADERFQIVSRHAALLHRKPYRLHLVRGLNRVMLLLPGFGQRRQHVQPITVGSHATMPLTAAPRPRDPAAPRTPAASFAKSPSSLRRYYAMVPPWEQARKNSGACSACWRWWKPVCNPPRFAAEGVVGEGVDYVEGLRRWFLSSYLAGRKIPERRRTCYVRHC